MAASVTQCRVSVCVSQGWWASSVTSAPLDSASPSVQVTTGSTTILFKSVRVTFAAVVQLESCDVCWDSTMNNAKNPVLIRVMTLAQRGGGT